MTKFLNTKVGMKKGEKKGKKMRFLMFFFII